MFKLQFIIKGQKKEALSFIFLLSLHCGVFLLVFFSGNLYPLLGLNHLIIFEDINKNKSSELISI